MDRRQAIALLTSVPAIATISRADLKAADTLVIECDGHLTQEAAAHIRAMMEQVFPGHKAIVLSEGMRLKVVSQQFPPFPPNRAIREGD